MPVCMGRSKDNLTTWESQFSLSTVSLRMELRLSLLAASSFCPLNYSLIFLFF